MTEKLMRDKLGETLRSDGFLVRQATIEEFPGLLAAKLTDDVNILLAKPTDPRYYADVLLALKTIAELYRVDWQTIEQTGEHEAGTTGEYRQRVVWAVPEAGNTELGRSAGDDLPAPA